MPNVVLPSIEAETPQQPSHSQSSQSSQPLRKRRKISKRVKIVTYEDFLSDEQRIARRKTEEKTEKMKKYRVEKNRENTKLRTRLPTPYRLGGNRTRQAQTASASGSGIRQIAEKQIASYREDTPRPQSGSITSEIFSNQENVFSDSEDRQTRATTEEGPQTPRRGMRLQRPIVSRADYSLLVSPSPLPESPGGHRNWTPRNSPLLSPTPLPSSSSTSPLVLSGPVLHLSCLFDNSLQDSEKPTSPGYDGDVSEEN